MVDWRHELSTTDPRYYKWTQWVFLQLYKRGLAYKKRRGGQLVPERQDRARQRAGHRRRVRAVRRARSSSASSSSGSSASPTTPGACSPTSTGSTGRSRTKTAQRNWIGRSDGAEIAFRVQDLEELRGQRDDRQRADAASSRAQPIDIRVFTTRPDTIFGATYLVLAPEHPLVDALDDRRAARRGRGVRARAAKQDLVTRKVSKEKTGVFTGAYAINPATRQPIPIWIADYVLMEYGTGAIMAVPGHDERDFEFATVFDLPIVRVVARRRASQPQHAARRARSRRRTACTLVNSGQFNGLTVAEGEARDRRLARGARARARPVVNYRLHDWCISRQRYWGPPIPIIYCDDVRHRAGAGEGSAGRAAVRRGLQARRHRRVAAGARRVVVSRAVPEVRRPGASRDRRVRHVPRQRVVFPALSEHGLRRRAVRPRR